MKSFNRSYKPNPQAKKFQVPCPEPPLLHMKIEQLFILDAPRYRNFYRQEEQDDEIAYKVAQFSRDSNPQYRSSTPQHQPSDDELPVLPTQGRRHEERPMTGMSRHEDRPKTGMSRHEDRPMTGTSRRDDSSPVRPPTGYPRL